ncbi:MAG: hypothetical protein QOH74_1246 [Gaiellales bacterium]|nr:hypothetical protein [Gaiellales bacterium]
MLIRATGLALALIALAAAGAEAKLPAKGGKSIVPGKSIGGVRLGMDAAAAVTKWGPGGTCDAAVGTSCRWDGTMKHGGLRFDVLKARSRRS